MRATFHRYDGQGPLDADVLQLHPDGTATLRIALPGDQAPATLVASRGTGEPGTWTPVAPDPAPSPIPPPDPTPSKARRKRTSRATVGPLAVDVLAGPSTCPMCLRKGRWSSLYCSGDCAARAAVPAGLDPWSTKRVPYSA